MGVRAIVVLVVLAKVMHTRQCQLACRRQASEVEAQDDWGDLEGPQSERGPSPPSWCSGSGLGSDSLRIKLPRYDTYLI